MDARELRIGNYVTDRSGKILCIDWFEKYKVCQRMFILDMEVHPLTEILNKVKPITITKELLLSLNFERTDQGSVSAQFTLFNNGNVFQLIWMKSIRDNSLVGFPFWMNEKHTVRCLHRLQNLYYELFNDELEIQKEMYPPSFCRK